MSSLRARLFKHFLNMLVRSRIDFSAVNIEKIRSETERLSSIHKRNANCSYKPIIIKHLKAEWITSSEKGPIILFVHGGAYFFGSTNTHRRLAAALTDEVKGRTLTLNYRLAPEHRFPAALEDVLTAYEWLIENKIDPKQMVIAGDSAGGALVLSTLITLRDRKLPLPAAGVCLSPWADLTCSGDSFRHPKELDPLVIPHLAPVAAHFYLGDADPKNPLASPLYANFEGIPPLFIQAGSSELLLDDSKRVAEKASQSGVEVHLDVWENMFHGWQLCLPFIPESGLAINKIARFIINKTTV